MDKSQNLPTEATAASSAGLKHGIKPRQLVMMSLGGAIGAGLFVGSGAGIAAAGPAILIAFLIAGLLVVLVTRMMGEMVAADPSSGAFSMHAERALGPVAGRTIGWLYWLTVVTVIAAEATAAGAITANAIPIIPQWCAALGYLVFFTIINLAGVSRFGAFEYWFSALKILAIIAFLGIGVLLVFGLIPGVASPGATNLLHQGGFAPKGIAGIGAGLLAVIFAFGGTEIIAIAAAETAEPSKNIGKAVRTIVWRILVFYLGSVLLMVTILPWHSEALLSGPFVAVLEVARVPGAAAAMTVVVVIALLSSLNAMLFSASRMIYSLAGRGGASQVFGKVSGNGVPKMAVLASVAFGFAAVVLNYLAPDRVLPLLLNAVGSTMLVVWAVIAISQIVLRRRAERLGAVPLHVTMWGFPYLSYLVLVMLALLAVLTLFDAAARNQLLATIVLTVLIAGASAAFKQQERHSSPDPGAPR